MPLRRGSSPVPRSAAGLSFLPAPSLCWDTCHVSWLPVAVSLTRLTSRRADTPQASIRPFVTEALKGWVVWGR